MNSNYLKTILVFVVALFLNGCTDDSGDNVQSCKQNGFKGVVIRSCGNIIACSNGELQNGKYVTTQGMIALEISITGRTGTYVYPAYFLEFKDN